MAILIFFSKYYLFMILITTMTAAAMSVTAASTTNSSSSLLTTFVFGDSLTEVGNNNYLQYSLARSDFPWYGIDFSGGKATGRFTNGRTIGDIICTIYTFNYLSRYISIFFLSIFCLKLIKVFLLLMGWDQCFVIVKSTLKSCITFNM